MDSEGIKFGKGPKELGGSVDLVNYYKLRPLHDFFCKRSVPSSISETKYLHNVVGETEIRKGQGMELDQLFRNNEGNRQSRLCPFDLETLREAFQIKEAKTINLPCYDRGIPTSASKLIEKIDKKKRRRQRHDGTDDCKDSKKQKRDAKNKGRNQAP